MEKSQHRHDISDKAWAILEPMLPGQRGQWGGIAEDNRRFINGVFWILRTGAPWRDLPPDYGKWGSVHQRFRRWRDKGIWEKILEALIDDPDYEWLMIDAIAKRVGKNQTVQCSMFFSAAEKKGRLVKPPIAMHAFHIFLRL